MDYAILEQSLTVVFGAGVVVLGQGGYDHHHDDGHQEEVWTHFHRAGHWGLGSADKVARFILIRNKRLSSFSKLMVLV